MAGTERQANSESIYNQTFYPSLNTLTIISKFAAGD
jgi:hypothetical protein